MILLNAFWVHSRLGQITDKNRPNVVICDEQLGQKEHNRFDRSRGGLLEGWEVGKRTYHVQSDARTARVDVTAIVYFDGICSGSTA